LKSVGKVHSMKQTVTQLIDDIDGGKADETVSFALDGTSYEIDLGKRNAAKLRSVLQDYTEHGRAVHNGRRRGRGRRTSAGFSGVDPKAVRAWAASNKIQINDRGRIPASVVEQYRAAGN
jgi:hypothetical protein